jgi:antitoxin (DNA-binding transcriptional repressor) of toxin-antitoxin stability system
MKVARLSKVKDELSRYVDYVRHGGRVRVLVRGVPAADLVPVFTRPADQRGSPDAALAELERQGVVRRGTGEVPSEILKPGPRLRGLPMAATVAEERRAGW